MDEMGFDQEDLGEYLHTTLDASLSSDEHFIIMYRKGLEHADPVVYKIEGIPNEDVLSIIEGTINHVA